MMSTGKTLSKELDIKDYTVGPCHPFSIERSKGYDLMIYCVFGNEEVMKTYQVNRLNQLSWIAELMSK